MVGVEMTGSHIFESAELKRMFCSAYVRNV